MLEQELKLGFGCMRLPTQAEQVDLKAFARMVDAYLAGGGRYFDTAHNYLNGQSETALRACLTSRYPRDAYILTDKLTQLFFENEADILPLFEAQLAACGVDYFDFYLCHAVQRGNYPKFVAANAFAQMRRLKEQGRIRHIGMSYHDTPELLERILQEQPDIEVVQLQFNYADYDNPDVESRRCYQVCEKYGKPVLVMEPVKGGRLMELPPEALAVFDALGSGSYASYAIRFCASFPNIVMVLSGMSDLNQMQDNLRYMKRFVPFSDAEYQAVAQVREILRKQELIPCTACRYCMDACPQQIPIPELFAAYNARKRLEPWRKPEGADPSSCVACGACENECPQHLEIRKLLKQSAKSLAREA